MSDKTKLVVAGLLIGGAYLLGRDQHTVVASVVGGDSPSTSNQLGGSGGAPLPATAAMDPKTGAGIVPNGVGLPTQPMPSQSAGVVGPNAGPQLTVSADVVAAMTGASAQGLAGDIAMASRWTDFTPFDSAAGSRLSMNNAARRSGAGGASNPIYSGSLFATSGAGDSSNNGSVVVTAPAHA